ncbi:hypothetical protein SVAN01_00611 [Stagonosporopsis vannaccii]|nr:hypothetical protein SVAN01_00611 [Stagonosporopsis vannaccii]
MGFRLFVPSGEGQHGLVPKRPDPLGATATLQYSVLGSTATAAAYTSFASRYSHRMTPGYAPSRPALFVRSLAKLGLWAGVLGVAADWYYSSRVASVVLSEQRLEPTPWKLYEKAKEFTVDDACLAGAGLGLAASIPALFLRRLAIPRWTRCAGLANAGACTGILGGHGYLQYTGERQKAYARLDRQLERRSIAFWDLCWNKQAMSRLNPLIQTYVRHNALLYAQQLSDSAFDRAEEYDTGDVESRNYDPDASSTECTTVQLESHYAPPFDYLQDLKRFNVQATHDKMEEHEAEIAALLKEADFILYLAAHREYEYCHLGDVDAEERRQRLEELQLLHTTHSKLRSAAEQLDSRLIVWRIALQHKAIVEAPAAAGARAGAATTPVSAWLPPCRHDFSTHDPALSIRELAQTQQSLDADISVFEEAVAHPDISQQVKERRRLDMEHGRSLMRVTDSIIWELEKMQDAARRKRVLGQPEAAAAAAAAAASHAREQKTVTEPLDARVDNTAAAVAAKSSGNESKSLEIGKS